MRKIWLLILTWINAPYFVWMWMLISQTQIHNPWFLHDIIMMILLTPFFWVTGMYYFAYHGWLPLYYAVTTPILYFGYRRYKRKAKKHK